MATRGERGPRPCPAGGVPLHGGWTTFQREQPLATAPCCLPPTPPRIGVQILTGCVA